MSGHRVGARDVRICCFGDSFTQGVGDRDGGWVGRLAAQAWDRGRPVTAYNLGVRRETSSDVVARWQAEAAPRLAAGDAQGVIFAFGINDTTREDGTARVSGDQSVRNLETALAGARREGWPALVVGPVPIPVAPRPDGSEDREDVRALETAFARTCEVHGVPFVPLYDALVDMPEWWAGIEAFGDGAHCDPVGYRMLADLIGAGGWWSWLDVVVGTPGALA